MSVHPYSAEEFPETVVKTWKRRFLYSAEEFPETVVKTWKRRFLYSAEEFPETVVKTWKRRFLMKVRMGQPLLSFLPSCLHKCLAGSNVFIATL